MKEGKGMDYDSGKGQNKQVCSLPMLCEVVKYTNCCYLEVFFLYFGHRCIITKSPQYCRPPISTWSRLALPFSSPPWPKLQLPVKISYVEWKLLKEHAMYFCWTLLKLLFLSSLINEWFHLKCLRVAGLPAGDVETGGHTSFLPDICHVWQGWCSNN